MLLLLFIVIVFVLLFCFLLFNDKRFWKVLSEIKDIKEKTLINNALIRTKTAGLTFDYNTRDCMIVLLKEGIIITWKSESADFAQYWYRSKIYKNKLKKVTSKGLIKSLEYDKKNHIIHLSGKVFVYNLFYFSYSYVTHRIELTQDSYIFESWFDTFDI